MQVHMMLLCCAIVLLFIFSLGTSGAPGLDNNSRCITSPAVVGGTGSMTFLFRQDLNMSSDIFHAYVIRTGDTANVLQCDRRKGAGITCDIINSAFEHTTIENHSLKLTAANVTPELAGNYTLWILADGSKEPPVECNFVVQNKTKVLPHQASSDTLSIVVPVVVVLVVVAAVLITGILILKRKNKLPCLSLQTRSTTDAPRALEENKRSEKQALLLDKLGDESGKLWHCADNRLEDEKTLRSFERNRVEGSFGIGRCPQNSRFYILKVYYGDKLNCFRLTPSENSVDFLDTGTSFRTLSELVAHYRKNDITQKDTNASYGRLIKPFEEAPEGLWYAGMIERHEQFDILKHKGHGAFLIRQSITKPNDYTLAMNIEEKVLTHRITVEDDGYTLGDADEQKYFQTLSALVEYYEKNDLYVDGKLLGKLLKPAQGITGSAAAGTQEESGTESK